MFKTGGPYLFVLCIPPFYQHDELSRYDIVCRRSTDQCREEERERLKDIHNIQKEMRDLENKIEKSENLDPGNDQNHKLTNSELETIKNDLKEKKEHFQNLINEGRTTSSLRVSPYATKSHTVSAEDFEKVFDKKASEEEIQRVGNTRNDKLPKQNQSNEKHTVLTDGDLESTEYKVPGKISSNDDRFIIYESLKPKKLIQFQRKDGKWNANIMTEKIEVAVNKDGVIFHLVSPRTEVSVNFRDQQGSRTRKIKGTRSRTRGTTARPAQYLRGCSGSNGNTRNR